MRGRLACLILAALAAAAPQSTAPDAPVDIRVDTRGARGDLPTIWAWFGNDEPNYVYMRDGRTLLGELADLGTPVHFRAHNLLTSGDGTAALKWGSTNVYTEDANGNPIYNWTILDRILDTYASRGVKPLFELGFMPEALSSHPEPYRHAWAPGAKEPLYTGWSYPPRDYAKWRELIFQVGKHVAEKYGARDVERDWLWEVWNEPDIGYWHGTPEEFMKLYDFAADGLRRALPHAKIGGPEVTGPNGTRTQTFLRTFLEHTLRGTNYATGQTGSPLDFVTFHAKGAPEVMADGHVRMNVGNQLRAIANGFAIVASFPELTQTPIVIGESDPEGCAACPVRTNPANAYRNGTLYSSYTAEQLARTYELSERAGVHLLGAVTWAFEFEDQPWFAGFRDLATNGVDKPVLDVFRLFAKMTGSRVPSTSTGARPLDEVRDASIRGPSDVSAIATADARSCSVLVWNYHDDDLPGPEATIALTIDGVPDGRPTLTHYRVDGDHSNAYTAWKAMGSPQPPTDAQRAALALAGRLQTLAPSSRVTVTGHRLALRFTLPRQGVSLVRVSW